MSVIDNLIDKTIEAFKKSEASKKIKAQYDMVRGALREIHKAICKTHPAHLTEGSIVYDENIGGHKVVILGEFVLLNELIENNKRCRCCDECKAFYNDDVNIPCHDVVATCYTCFRNLCESCSEVETIDSLPPHGTTLKKGEKYTQDLYFCPNCHEKYKQGNPSKPAPFNEKKVMFTEGKK